MNIKECIRIRSSQRKYLTQPLSMETIYDILDAARYAPSPKNRQPWRFAILKGKSKKDFVERCRENYSNSENNIEYLMKGEEFTESYTFDIIEQAPVLILIFNVFPSEISFKKNNITFDYCNMQSIGAAIENMLLRATELKVGSLWVGDILANEEFITNIYPGAGKLVSGVVLGYPCKIKENNTNRFSISELIIYNGG